MRFHCHSHVLPRVWRALLLLLALQLALADVCAAQPAAADETDAETLLRDADLALASGRYDDVAAITAALDQPRAVLLRARAAAARGRHDDAIRWLKPLADRDDPAALELAWLYRRVGRQADAEPLLARLLRRADVNDLASLYRAARAAHALGFFERANELFQDATAFAGHDADLQTAWGELLLEKHNRADAARSFRAALEWNRRHAPAYVGLARAVLDDDGEAARMLTGRALALNPAYVPALVFMAELALVDRDYAQARHWMGRALAVDPASLEARTLDASLAWIEDRRDDFERIVADLLAVSAAYGDVFRVAGAQAARHYRFEEAAALARRSLEVEPANAAAAAELGMHLLRTGHEDEARVVLERAFRADPYDTVTYNLLGLLDALDTFVTIEQGPIVLRLHPDEAPALREHALPLAEEALASLAARYDVTPEGPILIEIFPRHDDFAVRTLGLPGMMGALGACFGRVVTLNSPRARQPGTFNWQATLWHELAHVVTLQLSRQRVPRWLTEGLSVLEERRARPDWGRDIDGAVLEVLTRGEPIPLAELNAAFTRADSIGVAYYQASLVAELLVDRWGEAGVRRLLEAYGEGLDGDEALDRALGTTTAELDTELSRRIDERFGPIRAALAWPDEARVRRGATEELQALSLEHEGSYPVLMLLADALRRTGRTDEALDAYARAAALVPVTGEDSPLARAAELAESEGAIDRAVDALERLVELNEADIASARRLAALLDPETDRDRWLRAQARVAEIDPFDSAAHTALGRAAQEAGNHAEAARLFRVAVATGPRDPVTARCDLAEAYLALGASAEARRQTLAALELAPTYARAQELLLAIVDGRP